MTKVLPRDPPPSKTIHKIIASSRMTMRYHGPIDRFLVVLDRA